MKTKFVLFISLFAGINAAYSQIALNPAASRALGQPNLIPKTGNPNWVDGRELFQPEGVALDTSTSPPSIYVADTFNNRIMAWKNATGFTNGQPADLIIGQPDQYTTATGGPGTTFSTGLNLPIGLAVLNGDLFVADTGNNRILRYRAPLSNTTGNVFPDLWLGQPSLSSNTANYTGALSAQGLKLANSQSYLAFDSQNNLWVTDPGNNRVVRFPVSSFNCSACGGGAADTVIGQPNLTGNYTALVTSNQANAVIGNQFNVPGGIAFDAAGRLYVTDVGVTGFPGRVLVFTPPFQPGGQSAARILGVFSPSNSYTQAQAFETILVSPTGIFFLPDQSVGVTDSGDSRILIYPPFAQWPDPSVSYSPQATSVFGQNTYVIPGHANGTTSSSSVTPPPSATTVSNPTAAFYLKTTNELYLADSGNNRVTVLQVLPSSDSLAGATRVLGQDFLTTGSINLLEGREFQFETFFSNGTLVDAGIAIDSSGSVPHLYISDPGNHRVLGYKDMRNLNPSTPADLIIGQPSGATGLCNYPTGDEAIPSATSLCSPKGILVDSNGALYVADSGNGRVLRFPAPFSTPQGQMPQADLVIGQASFTSSIKDPSNQTMSSPYGVAITGNNGLLVSDLVHNRVLYFKFTGNSTFTGGKDNGLAATKVFGQPNFTTITAGSTSVSFNAPHHLACDSSGQFYVADTGNNRLEIFPDPSLASTLTTGQGAGLTLPTNAAQGVFVNHTTGEVWVANTRSDTAVRYPKYETLLFNQTPLDANPIQDYGPTLAVAQDQYGDLVLADASNRVSVFYPGLSYLNGASFATDKPFLAPGMIASLFPLNSSNTFGGATAANSNSTWPTTLGGLQLMFNGAPLPLDYVGPTQINFQVPNNAPTSGSVNAEVVQTATGQVLGAGTIQMQPVATGLFICDKSNGTLRQACVLNQDNTINSGTNPAARGSVLQIFATGVGNIPGAPPDGTPATAATPAPAQLRVYLGAQGYVDETPLLPGESNGGNFVKYSGLAPGLVGVWQVNVQIPMITAPDTQTIIALVLNGNVADPDSFSTYRATVAIK